MAVLLGVPPADLPATVGELRGWMDDMVASGRVRVTPDARRIARTVLEPIPIVPSVVWQAVHLVSLATLRPEIRRQYGIGWSPARERGVERLAAIGRHALPLLPSLVRHAPQYRAAMRRVRQSGL